MISPIKVNVDGLAAILEDYERDLVESKILPLIEKEWHDRFRFMVYDPFTDVVHPEFGRRDGFDLKSCDLMAAYMEAHISRCYGVVSNTLLEGEQDLRRKLVERGKGIGAQRLIEDLDRMRI